MIMFSRDSKIEKKINHRLFLYNIKTIHQVGQFGVKQQRDTLVDMLGSRNDSFLAFV